MGKRTLRACDTAQRRGITVALGALLLFAQAAINFTARGANAGLMRPPTPTASSTPAQPAAKLRIRTVTIIGARERKSLRRNVDKYVRATLVHHWNEPMARWLVPICPLVAGLRRRLADFVLERISRAAHNAHAPLADNGCRPNLFVVATDHPNLLLKKLRARDRWMYMRRHTSQNLDRFLKSRRPIRVWYNINRDCAGGAPTVALGRNAAPGVAPIACALHGSDMRFYFATSRSITSVYVIVNGRQLKGVTAAQMAGYVALVSLVRIQFDGRPTPAPSILSLFGDGAPPHGLTPWDKTLLYAVYHMDNLLKLQRQEIENVMFRRMLRRAPRER